MAEKVRSLMQVTIHFKSLTFPITFHCVHTYTKGDVFFVFDGSYTYRFAWDDIEDVTQEER